MKLDKPASTRPNNYNEQYSTNRVAEMLCHAPQSLRAALCRSGHFLGMVPTKLPNGRLLWDGQQVVALLRR